MDEILRDLSEFLDKSELETLEQFLAGQIDPGDPRITPIRNRISVYTWMEIAREAQRARALPVLDLSVFRAGMAARAKEARSLKPARCVRARR